MSIESITEPYIIIRGIETSCYLYGGTGIARTYEQRERGKDHFPILHFLSHLPDEAHFLLTTVHSEKARELPPWYYSNFADFTQGVSGDWLQLMLCSLEVSIFKSQHGEHISVAFSFPLGQCQVSTPNCVTAVPPI
jgi:hypothetical protein